MHTETLKPARGLRVRDPLRDRHLHHDGEPVTLDGYWRRRLRDGDVERVRSQPARPQAKRDEE
ncbi:DUF2635 domain-containing protein [Halomonas sp. ND22Bw]|uniref:DUF2635 domain-containing protein n=1 Tax=Halomonas sp. ND22Bw TaxID=2054178 RepID=UPI000D0BAFDF|nr:DUF2635 domain-containing protein [Halomonas sp. ND22Bw]